MELLYILIFILFIGFAFSVVIGLIKLLRPLLIILAIYVAYRYHVEKKKLEKYGYTSQETPIQNGDVFEADYVVKEEE